MKLLALVLCLLAVTQGRVLNDEDEAMYQAARATMDAKKFVTLGNRVYYIHSITPVKIPMAALLCNDLGMVLVSFETLDEYHLVRDYIQANEVIQYFYTTSGNEYSSDTWIWSGSGQLINDFEWAVDHPNDPPQYDSSIVFDTYLGWLDSCEDFPHYFVCEQK